VKLILLDAPEFLRLCFIKKIKGIPNIYDGHAE